MSYVLMGIFGIAMILIAVKDFLDNSQELIIEYMRRFWFFYMGLFVNDEKRDRLLQKQLQTAQSPFFIIANKLTFLLSGIIVTYFSVLALINKFN